MLIGLIINKHYAISFFLDPMCINGNRGAHMFSKDVVR